MLSEAAPNRANAPPTSAKFASSVQLVRAAAEPSWRAKAPPPSAAALRVMVVPTAVATPPRPTQTAPPPGFSPPSAASSCAHCSSCVSAAAPSTWLASSSGSHPSLSWSAAKFCTTSDPCKLSVAPEPTATAPPPMSAVLLRTEVARRRVAPAPHIDTAPPNRGAELPTSSEATMEPVSGRWPGLVARKTAPPSPARKRATTLEPSAGALAPWRLTTLLFCGARGDDVRLSASVSLLLWWARRGAAHHHAGRGVQRPAAPAALCAPAPPA